MKLMLKTPTDDKAFRGALVGNLVGSELKELKEEDVRT